MYVTVILCRPLVRVADSDFRSGFSDRAAVRTIVEIRKSAISMTNGDTQSSVLSLLRDGDTLVVNDADSTLNEAILSNIMHLYRNRLRRVQSTELKHCPDVFLSELRGNLLELRYSGPRVLSMLMSQKLRSAYPPMWSAVESQRHRACHDMVCLVGFC